MYVWILDVCPSLTVVRFPFILQNAGFLIQNVVPKPRCGSIWSKNVMPCSFSPAMRHPRGL
jgi:hypothetical protein